jgi:hypothetical protein
VQGFLVIKNTVDMSILVNIKNDFINRVDQSKKYNLSYGETIDRRAHFDQVSRHIKQT